MSATYDVLLSATITYRVDGLRADSDEDAKDIASSMWWFGEVDRNSYHEAFLDDATVLHVYHEGGDDEGNQEADSALGANPLGAE